MVLLAPSDDESKVCVAGPQDARPVRQLPAGRILDLLEASRSMPAREAASFLAREFSRLTDNGELPEGMVLADCEQHGAHWGILAAEGHYRLFQRRPPVGPATGQHVEIDTGELERQDRLYLGLLASE